MDEAVRSFYEDTMVCVFANKIYKYNDFYNNTFDDKNTYTNFLQQVGLCFLCLLIASIYVSWWQLNVEYLLLLLLLLLTGRYLKCRTHVRDHSQGHLTEIRTKSVSWTIVKISVSLASFWTTQQFHPPLKCPEVGSIGSGRQQRCCLHYFQYVFKIWCFHYKTQYQLNIKIVHYLLRRA